ncbi:MAG: PilZ domain-containing protein [Desulfobacteraceae bacterium]
MKIARYQMRDNFRVKVSADSVAELEIDQQKVRMEIDNLSLGGAYCLCKTKFKPLFDKARRLEDVTLKIALKNDIFIVTIDVVQVNRIEPHRKPKFFGIAFEFIRMQNDVRKKLVRYIYEMQRQFLQTRLKMEL